MESKADYNIIFIIGPPGSGKNTLSDSLVKKFNLITFGAGDLLREEIKSESENGKYIASIINQGNIVPVSITVSLVKAKMDKLGKENLFLIDGYPRNKDNIDGWNKLFNGTDGLKAKIHCLINLECSEEVCEKRLLNRGLTSGRVDDDKEVIKKRFNTHKKESTIVVDLMKDTCEIISINAESSPEVVIKEAIRKLEESKIF